MAIWSILWPFGLFYGHLVYFMVIRYIPLFDIMYRKKSGNPGQSEKRPKNPFVSPARAKTRFWYYLQMQQMALLV
jgi:hypothetical protein